MSFKKENLTFVPNDVPKFHVIKPEVVNYTTPKLFIPKINGKPTTAPGQYWYVYFYYRNEEGKFDNKSKFNFKYGINKYKTVKQRKAFGEKLRRVFTRLLEDGYNPRTNTIPDSVLMRVSDLNLRDALHKAFDDKKPSMSKHYISDTEHHLKSFLAFADRQGFAYTDVSYCSSKHIVAYLKYLEKKELNPKTINNHRAALSSLFGALVNDMVIATNPVAGVKKRKENPQKNRPFTKTQLKSIVEWINANDPTLLYYLHFVAYAFLRPVEIIRITVGDVHLESNLLYVKTKTEATAIVPIIPQLKKTFAKMEIENTNRNDFLFTRQNKPGAWEAAEKTKSKFFTDRFKKMKDALGFGHEYGIYSLRHTAAIDLYNSYLNDGLNHTEAELKMMPITRHKSVSGLRNYLREVGAMLPKDYGGDFTIEF